MSDIENIQCPIELQLQEEALKLARLKAVWNGCQSTMSPIANALVKIEIVPTLDRNGLHVYFSGNKDKLAKALRILRTSGFNTEADKPKPGSTEWYAWFKKPGAEYKIWFHFCSSVCRQVKTGTKWVEQDVYEVRCGEDDTSDRITDGGIQPALEEPAPALEHQPG